MTGRKKIFIVEDDETTSRILAKNLKELNFDVVGFVNSGAEAVTKTGVLMPDLVLMDIGLSGNMDGIEAAAIIKREYSIPGVYLSANSDEETIIRSQKSDPCGYIVKPVDKGILYAAVSTALRLNDLEKNFTKEIR